MKKELLNQMDYQVKIPELVKEYEFIKKYTNKTFLSSPINNKEENNIKKEINEIEYENISE